VDRTVEENPDSDLVAAIDVRRDVATQPDHD
jgi:hypothetical protein